MSELLAYLAGAIDADGCIRIKKTWHGGYAPMLTLKHVTPQVPELLKETFRGNLHLAKPSTPGGRSLYAWEVTSRLAAEGAARLRPWLRIKGAQADLLQRVAYLNEQPRGFVIPPVVPGEALLPAAAAAVAAGRVPSGGNQACRLGSVPCVKRDGRWFIPESYVPIWRDRPTSPPRHPEVVAELEECHRMMTKLNRVGKEVGGE